MGKNYTNYSKPQNNSNNQYNSVVTVQSLDEDKKILDNVQNEEIESVNDELDEVTIKGDLIEANVLNNEEPIKKKIGFVICNLLYLRNGHSIDDDVIGILDKNQKVEIILNESTSDFYRVHVNDLDGYCMKKYIKIR